MVLNESGRDDTNYFVNGFVIQSQQKMENKEEDNKLKAKKNRKRTNGPVEKHNINEIIQELKLKGNLPQLTLHTLLAQASSILQNQPTLLKLNSPLVVVGDIHGQFFDLLNIFDKFGYPPHTRYLFLGDYVDRGRFCVQVITLVLAMKINYPKHLHLLRGNHQGRTMTSFFNFKIECQKKYHGDIYQRFLDLFTKIPLCALVDGKYFAVHGGLSPNIKLISDLDKLNRFTQIPEQGPLCDLLWSDPLDENHQNWLNNKMRSCSYYYSRNQAIKFINSNNIRMVIRGHEVQMKGFKYQYNSNNEPLTLTIFSAPKYCDTYKNKGAVAILNGKNLQIRSFRDVEHPFVLSNYLNAFELSFPMMAVAAGKIFAHMLKNNKIRKSLKQSEVDVREILKTLQNVQNIEQLLVRNAEKINSLLLSDKLVDNTSLKDQDFENLFTQFINLKINDINQKLPTIFGPKQISFVRIKINDRQQVGPDDSEIIEE